MQRSFGSSGRTTSRGLGFLESRYPGGYGEGSRLPLVRSRHVAGSRVGRGDSNTFVTLIHFFGSKDGRGTRLLWVASVSTLEGETGYFDAVQVSFHSVLTEILHEHSAFRNYRDVFLIDTSFRRIPGSLNVHTEGYNLSEESSPPPVSRLIVPGDDVYFVEEGVIEEVHRGTWDESDGRHASSSRL